MKVTDKNFEEVMKSEVPVLVEFWGSWCPPCQAMKPIIEEIKNEYQGRIKVCEINIDCSPHLTFKYGVRVVPTFILFSKGKEIKRSVAAKSKAELKKMIGVIG